MDYKALKTIRIVDFLDNQGLVPAQKTADYYRYFAPGRDERTPSLTVYHKKNDWCDYKDSRGGDIGKLIEYLFDCDATKAFSILNEYAAKNTFYPCLPIIQPNVIESSTTESRIDIIELVEISDYRLINYLQGRKITLDNAKHFVKEAHWRIKGTTNDKLLHSLAFMNDKGGYVLRHKWQKKPITTKPAYFTTIEKQSSNQLNIFEGFIDFLSAMEYYMLHQPTHNTIILNSLSNLKWVIPLLTNYNKINLFLDNDVESQSGQKATEKLSLLHPCTVDYSAKLYAGFKDFNDFLQNKPNQPQKPNP